MSSIIPTPPGRATPAFVCRRVAALSSDSARAPFQPPAAAVASAWRFTDTPVHVPAMHAFARKTAPMSAIKGRAKRADNAPTVLLQARVTPDVREEVKAAAEASGVSVAYYLDTFLRELVRMNGALPRVAVPRPQAEELPIPAA